MLINELPDDCLLTILDHLNDFDDLINAIKFNSLDVNRVQNDSGHFEQFLAQMDVYAGLQEVPWSLINVHAGFRTWFSQHCERSTRSNSRNYRTSVVGRLMNIYPNTTTRPSVFNTGVNYISAEISGAGVGFINVHRVPLVERIFWTVLRGVLNRLLTGGTDFIDNHIQPAIAVLIVGDFNADPLQQVRNPNRPTRQENNGADLRSFLNDYSLFRIPSGATHGTRRYDHIIATNNVRYIQMVEFPQFDSDHRPVMAQVEITDAPLAGVPDYANDTECSLKDLGIIITAFLAGRD
uniref:Endonuclease/exonuclease/phosphatase domain-containing protein n=1 Tax=Tetranychus urticae TaxID=32264 RepID=T1L5Q6_TETUR